MITDNDKTLVLGYKTEMITKGSWGRMKRKTRSNIRTLIEDLKNLPCKWPSLFNS